MEVRRPSLLARGVIAFVRFYQRAISPLTPPSCRFTPSCSQYAVEAVQQYGAARGTLMAVWRVLRCHPFSRGGYDPPRWFTEPRPADEH